MEHLQKDFLREYNDGENVRRYMRKTAGHGISYLLQHEYNDIYLEAVDKYLLKVKTGKGLRLLEFGCGAGCTWFQCWSSVAWPWISRVAPIFLRR